MGNVDSETVLDVHLSNMWLCVQRIGDAFTLLPSQFHHIPLGNAIRLNESIVDLNDQRCLEVKFRRSFLENISKVCCHRCPQSNTS